MNTGRRRSRAAIRCSLDKCQIVFDLVVIAVDVREGNVFHDIAADPAQFDRRAVMDGFDPRDVPRVDVGLQIFAYAKAHPIARADIVHFGDSITCSA
jgi:hypothetical protein